MDVGTGGFLKVSKYNEEEEEKKRAAQVMRPVMTAEDQDNIKKKLQKIDQLLTKECALCGEFLLDLVGSAVIAD